MVITIPYYNFKKLVKFLFTLYYVTLPLNAFSSEKKLDFNFQDVKLKKAIDSLIQNYGLSIAYSDQLEDPKINVTCNHCSEVEALNIIMSDTGLNGKKLKNSI